MKPSPAPKLPDGTPWEKLDYAFRKTLTVSKEELLKAEAQEKQGKAKKRSKKAS